LEEDLQLEILEIVGAVRPPLDDIDLGVEGVACGIGQPVLEVVHDPIKIGRDGLTTGSNCGNAAFLTFSNQVLSRFSVVFLSRSPKMSSACSFSRYAGYNRSFSVINAVNVWNLYYLKRER
jgi:hypothetical protein